ncbi:hypothetical protein DMUE_3820 [Dictyocoela muelleri]|nr:hypothetical protein DMUE_3820 [Dictyocoela muelleri]
MFRQNRKSNARSNSFNKPISSLSQNNYLLLHGRIPNEPGMISLSAKGENMDSKHDQFVPQNVTFTWTLLNTNITIHRTLTMLKSMKDQDLFKWQEEILQTISLASWNEQTAVGDIKASVA